MIKIGVTSGMRGRFAVMYDEEGPIQTGLTARNFKTACIDAVEWAKSEFGDKYQQHLDSGIKEGADFKHGDR